MSYDSLLTHDLLIEPRPPSYTGDTTGQLISDSTGQPIGTNEVVPIENACMLSAFAVRGRVEEMTAKWPSGPGAGPELVDTQIFLPRGTSVAELDTIRRTDLFPQQVYQAVFVHDAGGAGHHVEVEARRIPL